MDSIESPLKFYLSARENLGSRVSEESEENRIDLPGRSCIGI